MDVQAYFDAVKTQFAAAGDPHTAQGQMAYMKHHFEFYGLKMPVWTALAKEIHQNYGVPQGKELYELVRLCFGDEHRELHYFGLQTLEKSLKKQPEALIDFLEELILTQSWWDTVDWVNKLVGLHFKRFPQLKEPVTQRWMDSGNFWLQRVCLIFQLTYREKTDHELLFRYIRRLAQEKEFVSLTIFVVLS